MFCSSCFRTFFLFAFILMSGGSFFGNGLFGNQACFAAEAVKKSSADIKEVKSDLTLVSFNIRYGSAKDGKNHWRKRREFVFETIKKMNPDIMGTQEVLPFQSVQLQRELPEYTYFGRGRRANPILGEQNGIFYRSKRFTQLGQGHFWLSKTPERAGTKDWDSSLPRMATWLLLRDRTNDQKLLILNTHFDHISAEARKEGAKLIRYKIEKLIKDASTAVILMGDFSCGEGSEPYQVFLSPSRTSLEGKQLMALADSYRAVHIKPTQEEGTFHNFNGDKHGKRIDWILFRANKFKVLEATINHTVKEGRYPSDHFPVTTKLRWLK